MTALGRRRPAARGAAGGSSGSKSNSATAHQTSASSPPAPREMTIAPASSRRRTTPTMRPCASSTTRLRCGGWNSISSRSISAPRSDMLEKMRAATSSVDAAQGDREVLLVDLLEHQLDRAVVELDDVLEGEQQQADLLGQLAVGLGQLVEHVALGRAVGVVEDVGERLDAAGGRVLLRADRRTACERMTVSTCATTSGRRLAHHRDPQRDVGLVLGRRACESTWAASVRVQVGDRPARSSAATRCAGRRRSARPACGAGTRTGGARSWPPGGR